jgi:hypothetical protein
MNAGTTATTGVVAPKSEPDCGRQNELRQRLHEERRCFAVPGQFKSGKSTLVNPHVLSWHFVSRTVSRRQAGN